MAIQVFGAPATVIMLNRAFGNTNPGNLIYTNQVTAATANATQFANDFASSYASLSNSALATQVLTNLGLMPNAALATALTDYYAANGASNRGAVTLQLCNILATREGDAAYGAAALAWNNTVASGYTYSANTANVNSGSGSAGQTFTLTTGSDNWVGTAADDSLNAVINSTASSGTLSLTDIVDAGAGTDKITVSLTGTTPDLSAATSPTLVGFELLDIKPLAANSTANLLVAPSITKLGVLGPVGTFGVSNIPAAVLDLTLTNTITDDADQTFTWKSGSLTGNADALTLRVDSLSSATTATANTYPALVIKGATTAQGFETINVVATGANSRVDSLAVTDGTNSTVSKVVLTGDKAFRVNTAMDVSVRTVDSTGSTGGINVGVTAGADVTLLGGAGNDRINMAAGLTVTDSLDGGAGTDTLAISQAGITASTDDIAKAVRATANFERLEFTNADAGSIRLAAITNIDYFTFSGAVSALVNLTGVDNVDTVAISASTSIAAAAAVTAGVTTGTAGADAYNMTPTLDGGSNVLNLVLNGITVTGGAGGAVTAGATANTGGAGGDAIDAPLMETVNITSTGSTAASTNTLTGGAGGTASSGTQGTAGESLIMGTNSTLNITGANDLTINSLVGTNITVNAGSFTGKLTVRIQDLGTGDSNDVITGGSGNDTISAGDGIDQIDLTKGGEDVIGLVAITQSGTEGASLAAIKVAADRDIITGFGSGSSTGADKLDVDLGLGTTNLARVTAAASSYTVTNTNAITEFEFGATFNSAVLSSSTDGTELLKGLGAGGALSGLTCTANDDGYIVAYDGTDAYLYYYVDGGNTTLVAAEIKLIAVLKGIATSALTDANFT